MNLRAAVQAAATQLPGPNARRDAETLLLHTLRRDRAWLLAHPEVALAAEDLVTFHEYVRRRAREEPLQYILGQQEFFGLALAVSPAVLIPRPETEILVEAVLLWAAGQPPGLRMADVGTGSGAIACALASRLPKATLFALDTSRAALEVAQKNAAHLGLAERVHVLESDLLAALPQPGLDAVVSNPPYIPSGEAASLEPQVRDFEPHTALFAGPDGLAVYRRLLPQAWKALRPGGLLALEFGFGQAEALQILLSGWRELQILPDLAGIQRVALAVRP